MQPFQCDLQPRLQETHRTTQTETHPKQLQGTVTLRQEKNDKPTAAATAAQTRYLSSSPAATLHGKTQGFVLWLPLHNIAHATFMQPFQCDLQPQLQETHRTTQTETHPKQLQSTVTLRQEKNDKPTAAATAAQTRYLSSSPAATLHGKTQGFVLWLPLRNIAHATFMQPFQCDLQPQLQETHRTTQTETHPKQLQGTVTVRQEKNDKPTAAATAAQTRYLSSSPAATLHGKTQGFVLWLPLHNIAHATFMQPFQCDLQPQLQETHRTTQTETHPKQLQGTVTVRQEKATNRPQPQPSHRRGSFHRRLQPLYTEKHKVSCSGFLSTTLPMQHSCSHSNAICNHSFKKRIELRRQKHTQSSFKAQLQCGKKKTTNRPQPQPSHRRGSFHRRLQPLYTEKHKVSCSGFLSATLPMQHSCSHSNAICNHSFKKRIELRRQKHTQSSFKAQLQCGKKKTTNRPQPQPSHRRGSFHRRLQPLYTEKHKVSCSGFLSTTLPMQHSCSHSNAICNHSFKKRIELRRQKHTQSSFKAQLQCGKKKTTNRPQPQPSHRRGSFHRRLQPLYTEKHKVSCSGFLSATLPMQHSCSHSNAICNHSFKKRIELRRQKHTQSSFKAQLQCGKKKTTNRPQPQPSHRRGSFHRRLQPLYTEKHKVSCSGFLPTT